MEVLILAGGLGTRLSEETTVKPKPMVEIGGKPILWHIMKIYSSYGFKNFTVLLGYKGYIIKEYFYNYFLHNSNVSIDLEKNEINYHSSSTENWKINLLDTGIDTMTGGRIKKGIENSKSDRFFCTYGDGLSNVNINSLLKFHEKKNKICTVTTVGMPGRFGIIDIGENDLVKNFEEKPKNRGLFINGGFFVFEKEIVKFIKNNSTVFEKEPLMNLTKENELAAYQHYGFWHPMDTLRDKNYLSELWEDGKAEWKIWN